MRIPLFIFMFRLLSRFEEVVDNRPTEYVNKIRDVIPSRTLSRRLNAFLSVLLNIRYT